MHGWFPPAVTCSICFPSDDHDDEEKLEELASESTGLRDERTSPVDSFYSGQQNSGVYADDLESRYQGASPPATLTGSTAMDPPFTVQCREESFQIALRAGSVSGVKVKGMCQGVHLSCPPIPPPKLMLDNLQALSPPQIPRMKIISLSRSFGQVVVIKWTTSKMQ